MKRLFQKALSVVVCLAILIGLGGVFVEPTQTYAAGIDVGANPTPKIDIAVNIPSDYPGTFLEFKQELTDKLIEQGLSPSDFRITTTAVTIDTTDTNGWYVYDHYGSQATYNALNLTADQKLKQPFRQADNTCLANGVAPMAVNNGDIAKFFPNNNNYTNNTCKNFNKHIYSYVDDEGKASMVFAGYGTNQLADFMLYPAASNSRRNFSFDINPAVIDAHTLSSFGFFLNAGIENGKLTGYILVFPCSGSGASSTVGAGQIEKITNMNADSTSYRNANAVVKNNLNMGITKGSKYRLTVELNKDSVTIQYQQYDSAGNLGEIKDLLRDFKLDDTGFNGFGPVVNYASHGCSSLSIMKYMDLEMSYEASAFDALKNVQFYEGADFKYFINLAGDKNDPGIPEETKYGSINQNYTDGINRMNENEIFYISNIDDGQIVTDTTKDSEGNVTHTGLGSTNGFYAPGDNYTEMMAQYITQNFVEGNKFQQAEVDSELPLANFYIQVADKSSTDQIMTIHLEHLVNAAEYNKTHDDKKQETVEVNIFDKSRTGSLSGADGQLTEWELTVYDPDNNVVAGFDKVKRADPTALPNFVFDKDSKSGRYTFTLIVTDSKGNKSKDFSTYITAFLDDEHPYIEGRNSGKNLATITLTDTGAGIDEDGITFIEDGRGSGVAAYWVTNDLHAEPTDDDWEILPFAQHTYEFDYDVVDTQPLVVWVKDECGNIGNKAVFQPTHVVVEDQDGNPIDDYYVIGDKPIIVLPEDDEVPDPEDPENEHFSGWTTPGGDPVTPGTTPEPEDNTIVIRPTYSTDMANIIYLSNGGIIKTSSGDKTSSEYSVVSNSSIIKKIGDHNVIPTRVGYKFTGWKLLKSDKAEDAGNETFINNAVNLEEITTQQATKVYDEKTGLAKRDTYYLVAQWEIATYTLRFDPNGGSYGNVKTLENIPYNTNIGTMTGGKAVPVDGRGIPTKPGYIFQGWSESPDNSTAKIFKVATGITGITPVAAPLMPDSDKTIYAVWKVDPNRFVVSFDSNGGSNITDQAYPTSTATNYNAFFKPSRTGYTFAGWFEKKEDAEGNVTFGDKEYEGGEAVIKKADHTFIAKWTANTNTKYTVDYYINNGHQTANGDWVYNKVNDKNINKTYEGTTEASVSVSDADRLAEITVDGVKYWYNAESSKNILSGTITGSPALSLKLYYDRYFDVVATKKGEGTVNGAAGVKEGQNTTVSWAAADGSYVSKVFIDGVVRDDLLTETSYAFAIDGGFHENHRIYVEFTKESENPPKPVNPNPPADVTKYYEVRTSVVGCADPSKYDVTPVTSVKAGDDHTVSWNIIDPCYNVVKIQVDGVDYDISDSGSIDFSGITSDHSVVITVAGLPTIGGNTVEGKYTITVNRYGGDENVIVSESLVVNKGENANVTWDTTGSEYVVYEVHIDGVSVYDNFDDIPQKCLNMTKYFRRVDKNHVVDIYLTKPETDGSVIPPDFEEEKFVQVETQIVGAPGSITGGAVLEQGSNYNVDWNINLPSNNDPDSDDYKFYEIEKIVIGDEDFYTKDEDGVKDPEELKNEVNIRLENIEEDTKVTVYAKPVLHRVTILKYGNGTVSSSKTVYHLANYKNLEATPDAGWSVAKIVVDSVVTFEVGAEPEVQTFAARLKDARDADPSIDDLTGIVEDHIIEVYFTEDDAEGNPTPAPSTESLHKVNVVIEGGAGTTDSNAIVADGADNDINWTVTDADKYEVKSITVNGVKRDSNDPFALENITEDMNVVITLGEKALDKGNDVPVIPTFRETVHNVTAIIRGEQGTIVGGGEVTDKSDKTVSWTAAEGNEVKYVFINGELRDDLLEAGSVLLENITEDQTVVVIIGKPNVPPVNVDKDGDGEPDINIDTDDDGEPDVDIDKDGDGEPDINIDKDGDGEPDINIDKDGDGEPDVNIDTDDDGEPDINIDKNGDGEPDVNIDKDGDGKPDVNVDTDDDGEPDINIDKDGDGEPDVNIDTDDDGEPDINVDTDGDGEPDLNIDTDKDGEPDVNVDTDGDGEPDINIDTDNDGEPDVNIDTDNDGKPDVNVDTDGDGEPDINIDTNGDGEPDINIDINKDGKPDINIDKDGDGKPDVNVDLNGDWIPDVNIDTTGDGVPDTNIDADGDGKVDEPKNPPVVNPGDNQENPPVVNPGDNNQGNNNQNNDQNNNNQGNGNIQDNPGSDVGNGNVNGNTADSVMNVWFILSMVSLLAVAALLFVVKRRRAE